MTVDLTPRERILFVCTANIDRSRTAEDMYREDARYEVRSAGVAPFATVVLTRDLLLWADRVFVDLDVEDRWHRGDPELVARLARRLRPHLGAPARDRKAGRAHNQGSEG